MGPNLSRTPRTSPARLFFLESTSCYCMGGTRSVNLSRLEVFFSVKSARVSRTSRTRRVSSVLIRYVSSGLLRMASSLFDRSFSLYRKSAKLELSQECTNGSRDVPDIFWLRARLLSIFSSREHREDSEDFAFSRLMKAFSLENMSLFSVFSLKYFWGWGGPGGEGEIFYVCVPFLWNFFEAELYGILIEFKSNETKNLDLVCRHKKHKNIMEAISGKCETPKKAGCFRREKGGARKSHTYQEEPL